MYQYTRDYLMNALAGNPEVVAFLLCDVPGGSSAWDRHPDPERFSLREITAHLAVWEGIFADRMTMMRDQHEPALQQYREEELAVVHAYANSDPADNLSWFGQNRAKLVETLRGLDAAQWQRSGKRGMGPMTIEEQAVLVLAHDGYHIQQILQWLEVPAAG